MEILIISVGPVERDLLDWLVVRLPAAIGRPVAVGEEIRRPMRAFSAKRRQYRSDDILEVLQRLDLPGAYRKAGLIDADCYSPGLHFIFGQARPDCCACVVALPRLRQSFYGLRDNPALFRARVLKEIVHELGHTEGLVHCPNRHCVMHFSNALADTDVKGAAYCARCKLIAGNRQ